MYLQKVISRQTQRKKSFLLASEMSRTKIAGSRSIGQGHGSADPDPHQNVTDPQYWFPVTLQAKEDGAVRVCGPGLLHSGRSQVLHSGKSISGCLLLYIFGVFKDNCDSDLSGSSSLLQLSKDSPRVSTVGMRIESGTHTLRLAGQLTSYATPAVKLPPFK